MFQEGRGRKDRKLAVAYHRRRNGMSVFRVAQNVKGLLCSSDESYVGSMTANLMGSKYYIWDKVLVNLIHSLLVLPIGPEFKLNVSGLLIPLQGVRVGSVGKLVKPLLSVVM